MQRLEFYDLVIIGGGPAGMSAAVWASDLGLRSVLIEKTKGLGGQLSMIHNPIRNYLGVQTENGRALCSTFLRSLDEADFDRVLGIPAASANLLSKRIKLGDGREFEGRAVIIATGIRRRKLCVEGEDRFRGKGILSSGAKEAGKAKGKNVLIVGGGDAAIENALILSKIARTVAVVHRRTEFAARDEFLQRARGCENITFITNHVVDRFSGHDSLESATLRTTDAHSFKEIQCDLVLIRIGVQPNSELFDSQLDINERGYIRTNSNCQTNLQNVYAVGDVANPVSPTIATAAGTAATAVKHCVHYMQN